jgi:cytochrome b6-f complex iron-sulfur subunit
MTQEASAAVPAASEKKTRMNRREFLNFAWLASLGFLMVDLAGVTYIFAMPRFKAGEFGGKVPVGNVSELPSVGSAPVNFPKVKLWLSNQAEGVVALYKVCTHLGCLYNWNNQEVKFICPCHGSQFQADGTYIHGPASRSTDRFVIQIVDANGNVIAETNKDGDPLPVPDDPNAQVIVDTGQKILGKTHA